MGVQTSVFPRAHLVTELVDSVKFRGPVCHAWPRRERSLAAKLSRLDARKNWQEVRWNEMQASSENAQGVIQNTVDETWVRCDTKLARRTQLLNKPITGQLYAMF